MQLISHDSLLTVLIGLSAAVGLYFLRLLRFKKKASKISSSTFITLGLLFTPLGVALLIMSQDSSAFFILGMIYLLIGLWLSKTEKKKEIEKQ